MCVKAMTVRMDVMKLFEQHSVDDGIDGSTKVAYMTMAARLGSPVNFEIFTGESFQSFST